MAPSSLLHNLKHNKILHEKNVILTVKTDDAPRVGDADRICVQKLDAGFWQVVSPIGYMETPDIPSALARLSSHGLKLELLIHIVLRLTPVDPPVAAFPHAVLAGQALREPRQIRQRRNGILPDPRGARGGSRYAGDGLGSIRDQITAAATASISSMRSGLTRSGMMWVVQVGT